MEGPNGTLGFESLAARLPGARRVARAIHGASRFHWSHAPWLPGKWRVQQLALMCLDCDLLEPVARVNGGLSFEIDTADYVQRHVFATGGWEEETTRLLLSCFERPGSFLDVGAHVGYFTLIGARELSGHGRVHAFEPVPSSFLRLRRNVESNQLDNVVLNNAACWSTNGEVTVHEANAMNRGKSSVLHDNADSPYGPAVAQHRVRAITIDEYVAGLGEEAISVIKVDVEGCEADVLEGARKTIEAHQPVVLLEVMPKLLETRRSSASELVATLGGQGYRCHLVDWDGPANIERGSGNVAFTVHEQRLPQACRVRLSRLTELRPADSQRSLPWHQPRRHDR